jgi:hypothetical protein
VDVVAYDFAIVDHAPADATIDDGAGGEVAAPDVDDDADCACNDDFGNPSDPSLDPADDAKPPCQTGADCSSGVCLTKPDGTKECAPPCWAGEACPEDWECKGIVGTGGDMVFVCLPTLVRLCRPCAYHEDCRNPGVPSKDACVSFGAEGSFCGLDCSEYGTCPAGYGCEDAQDPADRTATLKQCVPEDGTCECSAYAIENGFKTACYKAGAGGGVCKGERKCGPGGLTQCDAKEPSPEECDGLDNDCNGAVDDGIEPVECAKEFGGLVCKGTKACEGGVMVCNAQEPGPEACDGADNDCDGQTDPEDAKGCTKRWLDGDEDGVGTGEPRCLCAADGKYTALAGGDCDDTLQAVHPGANEVCNQLDDDCDSDVDEEGSQGCKDYWKDHDQDGYGATGDKKCLCTDQGEYTAGQGGDCDDEDASVHGGVSEICNGVDDDCDGLVDEEGADLCIEYWYDSDGDGWGVQGNSKCLCDPLGKYQATKYGDCDDNNAAVHPEATEFCNGKDDDCDGGTDEAGALDCTIYHADKDKDGYGSPDDIACLCAKMAPWTLTDASDCNDQDVNVHPGATEVCNGKDDDCNTKIDEENALGCDWYLFDGDGDGWGLEAVKKCLCEPTGKYTATQGPDCNDADADIYQNAPEKCDNKDNDCDGLVDEGEGGPMCKTFYEDADNDGYGVQWSSKCLCKAAKPFAATQYGDCDDTKSGVHPGGTESCNGLDDDCDGQIDEGEGTSGCSTWYKDGDSDGYGVASDSKCYCKATGSYKIPYGGTTGDCDDTRANVHPGLAETCDGLDNDCSGGTDEPFVPESYYDYNDYASHTADLPNGWMGPTLQECGAASCTGSFQGRLLPGGDEDWLAVYKEETNDWIVDLKGSVTFKGAPGVSYQVCICYSQSGLCDQSGQVCATSVNGAQVTTANTVNGDSWGSDDSAYLDIQVKALSGAWSCTQYQVTWTVWE